MTFKFIVPVIGVVLSAATFNSIAAITSVDWQMTGDNLVTRNTSSGLDWLDLSVTENRSYNDVGSKFGSGQEFEGWRHATIVDITGFFDAFGGDSNYYTTGWSMENNGLFDAIAPYWGDLSCNALGCEPGEGASHFIYDATDLNLSSITTISVHGFIYDHYLAGDFVADWDQIRIAGTEWNPENPNPGYGNALVRDISVVPVPAAIWLFASGLLGLTGLARRKV